MIHASAQCRGRILEEERRQFGHLPGYVPTQFAELGPTSILMLSEDPLFRSVTIRDGQGREAFSDVELRLLDDGRIELSRPRLTRNERREQATGRRPRQDMVVICDGRPSGATRARRAAGRAARSLMRGIIRLGFDEEWLGDGHDGTMFERAS